MSTKMTCPACETHTSSVWAAYRDGEPCPECGLSNGTAAAIAETRRINEAARRIFEDTDLDRTEALRLARDVARIIRMEDDA